MEEVLPDVWVDGAHNADGIEAFLASIRADKGESSRILLYSSLAEKACGEMAGKIRDAGVFEEIVVTGIDSYRAADAAFLAGLFGEREVTVIEELREAFRYCLRRKAEGRKVYITGSLYLTGQIKALIREEETVREGQRG